MCVMLPIALPAKATLFKLPTWELDAFPNFFISLSRYLYFPAAPNLNRLAIMLVLCTRDWNKSKFKTWQH
jgi:hypothetical protein